MKVRVWRAAYRDQNARAPRELEAGFLIERFGRPPWELGLTRTRDIGFMYRALEAVHVWRCAQKYQTDWAKNPRAIVDDEWRTISQVLKEVRRQENAVTSET